MGGASQILHLFNPPDNPAAGLQYANGANVFWGDGNWFIDPFNLIPGVLSGGVSGPPTYPPASSPGALKGAGGPAGRRGNPPPGSSWTP